MGKLLSEHKTTAKGYLTLAMLMLGSLAVGGGMIAFGIFGGPGDLGGRVVISILGGLALAPAGFGFYGLRRGRGNALRLFEHGIVAQVAGVESQARWEEIQSYADGLFLQIGTRQGSGFNFALGGLRAADAVFAKLREEVVVRRLLPELRTRIEGGESVEIDGVEAEIAAEGSTQVSGFSCDASGVTPYGQPAIAWSSITGCGVIEGAASDRGSTKVGCAFVACAAGRFHAAFEQVSDRELLLALCEALGSRYPATRSSPETR